MAAAWLALLGVLIGGGVTFLSQLFMARWQDQRENEKWSRSRAADELSRIRTSQKDVAAELQRWIFELYDKATLVAMGRLHGRDHARLSFDNDQMKLASYRVAQLAYQLRDRDATLAILIWRSMIIDEYVGDRPNNHDRMQRMYEVMQSIRDGFNEHLGQHWQMLDLNDTKPIALPSELSAQSIKSKVDRASSIENPSE